MSFRPLEQEKNLTQNNIFEAKVNEKGLREAVENWILRSIPFSKREGRGI